MGEVADFTKAWRLNPDEAVEDVVDALLETRSFGEHWARQWLDVARYGESSGSFRKSNSKHNFPVSAGELIFPGRIGRVF